MDDCILQLQNVSKNFGGIVVLDDVSLNVANGARHALIGPNGAGKTTLFNLISGVFPIDSGTALFEGQNLSDVPSRKRIRLGIARSFQNIRLMPHLSVVENVMLGQHSTADSIGLLKPTGWLSKSKERQEIVETLNAFGLDTYSGEIVESLPYGIRKKIEIVRALVSRPSLLMLDEPAAGLNPVETGALRDFLLEVAEGGVTLLVVEHDMPFVNSLCEHVTVLNFGRRIFDGPAEEARNDEAVLEAYLGRKNSGGSAHAA
jgi:branched-chain amino acid transport system ATP-binding protein